MVGFARLAVAVACLLDRVGLIFLEVECIRALIGSETGVFEIPPWSVFIPIKLRDR